MRLSHKHKKKFTWLILALVGFSMVVALILYFLSEQANYYYDPTSIVQGQAPLNKTIRAGGVVVKGSVQRNKNNPLQVKFIITDFAEQVSVSYSGFLPDLFKEGSGVVVQGKLFNKIIVADKVLAKHDENYMPPEVEKSLK